MIVTEVSPGDAFRVVNGDSYTMMFSDVPEGSSDWTATSMDVGQAFTVLAVVGAHVLIIRWSDGRIGWITYDSFRQMVRAFL